MCSLRVFYEIVELNNCDRDFMVCKTYLLSGPLEKKQQKPSGLKHDLFLSLILVITFMA